MSEEASKVSSVLNLSDNVKELLEIGATKEELAELKAYVAKNYSLITTYQHMHTNMHQIE